MTRYLTYLCLAVTLMLDMSCGRIVERERVNVSLRNSSTQSFDWAEVYFGENKIAFGVLGGGGGGGKTYLYYEKPVTEQARIKLIDTNHNTNEYVVSVKGVYDPKKPGTLVFEITPKGVVPHFTPLE